MLGRIFKFFDSSAKPKSVDDGKYKYCPRCGDEFRADFMNCSVCNVALEKERPVTNDDHRIDKRIKRPENTPIRPGDKVVSIQQGALIEIKRLKNVLEDAGVPSLIYAETPAKGG